jgi:hypothetical protein
MPVLETWPVRNSAATLANHTHFRGFPRTLQANTDGSSETDSFQILSNSPFTNDPATRLYWRQS